MNASVIISASVISEGHIDVSLIVAGGETFSQGKPLYCRILVYYIAYCLGKHVESHGNCSFV